MQQKQIFVEQREFQKSSLKSHTNLEINLNKKVCTYGMFYLGIALEQCTDLSILTLRLSGSQLNYIGDEGISDLCSGLLKCVKITNLELNLEANMIGSQGLADLSVHFSECKKLSSLTLIISQNQINPLGTAKLGSYLSKCANLCDLFLTFDDILSLNDDEFKTFSDQDRLQNIFCGLAKCSKVHNLKFKFDQDIERVIIEQTRILQESRKIFKMKRLVKFQFPIN
ncbi:hypothetical protein ABPG73_008915 [Tetrahymena malaccensis]